MWQINAEIALTNGQLAEMYLLRTLSNVIAIDIGTSK